MRPDSSRGGSDGCRRTWERPYFSSLSTHMVGTYLPEPPAKRASERIRASVTPVNQMGVQNIGCSLEPVECIHESRSSFVVRPAVHSLPGYPKTTLGGRPRRAGDRSSSEPFPTYREVASRP